MANKLGDLCRDFWWQIQIVHDEKINCEAEEQGKAKKKKPRNMLHLIWRLQEQFRKDSIGDSLIWRLQEEFRKDSIGDSLFAFPRNVSNKFKSIQTRPPWQKSQRCRFVSQELEILKIYPGFLCLWLVFFKKFLNVPRVFVIVARYF